MNRETKTYSFQIKDLGIRTDDAGNEFGQIESYGAIFGNVDEGNDLIVKGAFTRTIQNSKQRAKSRSTKYIAAMLWQHDTHEIIGGWYDLSEDDTGLLGKGEIALATQRGREYYALAKAGMTDQFSIIYDVPQGGSKYRKDGVRELTELRLFSIDPVTFAMNDETFLVDVKAFKAGDGASVCGNTHGPLGPRDEEWDGSKAKSQIWAAAYDSATGKIDEKLAKKYFMVISGDGQEKGSYSYPFWYVGSSPHICVGAVKTIAAALQGSRGAHAPAALRPKIEKLYNRISAKYPDDPKLTPPWQDSEKGDSMSRNHKSGQAAKPVQQKTFQEHFNDEQCGDLLEDFQDVHVCALAKAVLDAFKIGDQPEADVREALTQFNAAVMEWVDDGVKYGLSEYLEDNTDEYSSAENTIQYGSDSRPNYGYGYMSRHTPQGRKAMTASDATTGGFTADHVAKIKTATKDAMKAVNDHAAMLKKSADLITELVDHGGTEGAKAGRQFSAASSQALQDHADGLHDAADDIKKSVRKQTKAINNVADDLATVLQGSEGAYGTDAGNAGNMQEGKSQGTPPMARSRQESPSSDTISDDDARAVLSIFKSLHKSA